MSPKKYINQEHEVLEKLNEYNKAAGFDPLVPEVEKLKVSDANIDLLLEGKNPEKSFELFDLYRRSKRGIHSITVKRGSPFIFIEYDMNIHPKVDFSKRSHALLYGKRDQSKDFWKSLQLSEEVKYLRIDVRSDFPIISKDVL